MLKYPNMREELLFNIRVLADVDFQKRVWINQEEPRPKWYSSFDLVYEFLFEHMQLDAHLDRAIGIMLHNETEANAIKAVTDSLKPILENVSLYERFPSHLIDSAEWQEVVKAARNAYHVLNEGKDPGGLFEDVAADNIN